MKIYIAASWSRRSEIRKVASELEELGVRVGSRWLGECHKPSSSGREKFLRETALIDVADVRACDALVRFADDLTEMRVPSHLATGARMFEMGLAYALGKPIYVVGGKQNVFDRLPNLIHIKDAEHLKRELCPTEIH